MVKSSPDLKPWEEADAMQYIAKNTNIPVPKVFQTCRGASPSIVMEYIDGKRLDEVWNDLPEASKLQLSQQLREILTELRELKGDFIGPFSGGPVADSTLRGDLSARSRSSTVFCFLT